MGIMTTTRSSWLLLPVFVLIAVLVAAFWHYVQDDVFITYVYSRNIAEGVGFVFNPGERVQGTTTPLWTLLMAAVYKITPDLLHAGNLLGGLSLCLTCWLVFRLTAAYLSLFSRVTICLLLATSPLVYASLGMETLLYCAILVLAFWLWAQDQRGWAMLAAAALTWTRADGLVLAGTLGLAAVFTPHPLPLSHKGRGEMMRGDSPENGATCQPAPARDWYGRHCVSSIRLGLVYAVATLPWFVFAWVYFGTPLPNTFSAKQAILSDVLFWTDGMDRWRSFYGNNPLSLLAVVLVPLGVWRMALIPHLRPIPAWAVLYTVGYTVLNVTNFWYYTPLVISLIALAVGGGEWVVSWLARRVIPKRVVYGGVIGIVGASAMLGFAQSWELGPPPPRMATYRLVGEWIAVNTPPDARLMLGDLGIVGYYARRNTMDSPGLITPDMHIKTPLYAALKYKRDLLAAPLYLWNDITETDWFKAYYVPIVQVSTPGDVGFSPMTVYRRRLALDTPGTLPEGYTLPLTCVVELGKGEVIPNTPTQARLLAASDEIVAEAQQPFLNGLYPAERTPADERLVEQIGLNLHVPPGSYRWELVCANQTYDGAIVVQPITSAEGYTPLDAMWADFAALRGVVLPEGVETWSGGSALVGLHWEALGAAASDYSVFLHWVDAGGQVVAQVDGSPREGERPANTWQAGETVIDWRRIRLPSDLPEGEYALLVGWYDWRSLERLTTANNLDAVRLPVGMRNRFPGGSGMP